MQEEDVLIVGAGPTGLLLGIWLKTLAPKSRFTIIDKATGPGTTSRAMVVHARTIEFYRQLGLDTALLDQAQVLKGAAMMQDGKIAGHFSFHNVGTRIAQNPVVLSFPQDRHERLLATHLESLGVHVSWNTELTNLIQHDTHAEASFSGSTKRFSYVAGCDGAHSAVRHISSLSMIGGTYPQRFLVADVIVTNPASALYLNICPGSHAIDIFIPLDEAGHVRVFHSVSNYKGDETFQDFQADIEASTGLQIEKVTWFSLYKCHHRLAENFQKGRIFLLGDAAHLHSPAGGQGMNTGLGDATNLGWKLASVLQGRACSEILHTYAIERTKFAEKLVYTTDRAFSLVTSRTLIGSFMRRIWLPKIIPFLWKFQFFRRIFFTAVSQLGIAYPHSPLSEGSTGTLKPGMRLPWVQFGATDNHAALTPPHWQIHVYGRGSLAAADDWKGFPVYKFEFTREVEAAGFAEGTVYFVRPDGHLGVVCGGGEEGGLVLERYIGRWGLEGGCL